MAPDGSIRGRGGRTTLWAFGWGSLADLLGTTADMVKGFVKIGQFDPTDLQSIYRRRDQQRQPCSHHDLLQVSKSETTRCRFCGDRFGACSRCAQLVGMPAEIGDTPGLLCGGCGSATFQAVAP